MATINSREDQDGITIGWQAIVRRKGHPSQTKTFRAKKEAEAWARSVESEMDRGVWRDRSVSEGTTLKECLARYIQEVVPTKKGDGRRETGFARQWIDRPIACRFMAAIRGRDVADAIREKESVMRTTQQMSITLPNDMADVVKTKVRPGEYASEAERRRAMDDLVAQAQEIGMGYD